MVYLGGPWRGVRRPRLHDAPPGYRRPRPRIPLKERQRIARQDWILEHVLAVILVLLAATVVVIICLAIVMHH
jgi:hypothetical protein